MDLLAIEIARGNQVVYFSGSCAFCVVPGSSSAWDARAKQIKVGQPIHLPFQECETRNVPRHLSLAQSQMTESQKGRIASLKI
jgi:hypothetical protein